VSVSQPIELASPFPNRRQPRQATPQVRVIQLPLRSFARRLVVSQARVSRLVPIDDVALVSASGNYARFHLRNGVLSVRETLESITDALADGFVRVNRSATVNLAFIREVESTGTHGECTVVLHDGTRLGVSRIFVAGLRAAVFPGYEDAATNKRIRRRRGSVSIVPAFAPRPAHTDVD